MVLKLNNKIGDSKNYLITLSTFLDMILDK